jgi:beta-lactamase class A
VSTHSRHGDLRRTVLSVVVVVSWIVLAGIVWRQMPTSSNEVGLSTVADGGRARPAAIVVEPGMTIGEIGEALEMIGLDTRERTLDLARNPSSLQLPAEMADIGSLDGYLAPGRYTVTPTSDAPTLLSRMAQAFSDQLRGDLTQRIEDQGLALDDVVRISGLAQLDATTSAELPVVAGVLWNQVPNHGREIGAVGSAAITAALAPITTSATEYHHATGGWVVLGPAPEDDSPVEPPTDLEHVANSLFDPLGARVGLLAIDLDGNVVLDHNAGAFFETASVYKLAVLAVIMDEVEDGRLDLDLTVSAQLPASDLGSAQPLPAEVTLREALRRSIEISDNASAEALLFGLGTNVINHRLRSWGIEGFNVGSQPQVATPHGVAQLLTFIELGTHHDEASRAHMLDWLRNTPQNDRLPRLLPGLGPIAHKIGDLEEVVNDAGIIPGPDGPIVVVAMIGDVEERTDATEAIAGYGQLINSWLTRYLPATVEVRSARLQGCERGPTTATGPLAGARIVVDAAHGGDDLGTVVPGPGGALVVESHANLLHAEELAIGLTQRGATVLLTRCSDTSVSAATRAVLANQWEADLLVSIDLRPAGAETEGNEASITFHRLDAAAWADAFADENRVVSAFPEPTDPNSGMPARVARSSPTLLHLTMMPGVVLGTGELSHTPEALAVWEAVERNGDRLRVLASITAGRLAAVWDELRTDPT